MCHTIQFWLYATFDELAYKLMVFNKTKRCNLTYKILICKI